MSLVAFVFLHLLKDFGTVGADIFIYSEVFSSETIYCLYLQKILQ